MDRTSPGSVARAVEFPSTSADEPSRAPRRTAAYPSSFGAPARPRPSTRSRSLGAPDGVPLSLEELSEDLADVLIEGALVFPARGSVARSRLSPAAVGRLRRHGFPRVRRLLAPPHLVEPDFA